MKNKIYDIIIVGSGPAAYAFLQNDQILNNRILLIDNDLGKDISYTPNENYLDIRYKSKEQFDWSIGHEYSPLKFVHKKASPKMSLNQHHSMNKDLSDSTKNFFRVNNGSMGGMSNIWGAGIARYDENELSHFPFQKNDLNLNYDEILKKLHFVAGLNDDLSDYLKIDSKDNIELDHYFSDILSIYNASSENDSNFFLGRSRLAVNMTSEDTSSKICNYCGNCFWGCGRKSIFNSRHFISSLIQAGKIDYINDHIIRFDESVAKNRTVIFGKKNEKYYGRKIVLAAGTIETTKIILRSSTSISKAYFKSSPTLGFLGVRKKIKSKPIQAKFALAQLSFYINTVSNQNIFGSLFNGFSLPISELAKYLPFSTKLNMYILSFLLNRICFGNVFFSGEMSAHMIEKQKNNDGFLITGGYHPDLNKDVSKVSKDLINIFNKYGLYIPSISIQLSEPGSDAHYACSLPMKKNPKHLESYSNGLIYGTNAVHAIDGSVLSYLSEKSHTLTIMANALRISKIFN